MIGMNQLNLGYWYNIGNIMTNYTWKILDIIAENEVIISETSV